MRVSNIQTGPFSGPSGSPVGQHRHPRRPPTSSGRCVAELFGSAIGPKRSLVRMGVKAHHDPRLRTDVADAGVDIDATQLHTYAAEWNAHRTRCFVDDVLVRTVEQGIGYPQQLMVDLFEFPAGPQRPPEAYPKSADVRKVRGWTVRG